MDSLVAASPMSQVTVYTPRIKKVLKSYQQAASNSIAGPHNFESGWLAPSATSPASSSASHAATLDTKSSLEALVTAGHSSHHRQQHHDHHSDCRRVSPGGSSSVKDNHRLMAATAAATSPSSATSFSCSSGVPSQYLQVSPGARVASGAPKSVINSVLSAANGGGSGGSQRKAAAQPSPVSGSDDCLALIVPPPLPIQKAPIIVPPDESSVLTKTTVRGETIWCFVIGGEQRLCLPQLLNTILDDFNMNEITEECVNLQINCSRCSPGQLDALKTAAILPLTAPSCGLITRTDAEHLIAALVDKCPPKAPAGAKVKRETDQGSEARDDTEDGLRVYHECFNKCYGLLKLWLYTDSSSPCIECQTCSGLFAPNKFVCHSHRPKVTRTIHWGFNSDNWRLYLQLAEEQLDCVPLAPADEVVSEMKSKRRKRLLLEMKAKFSPVQKVDCESVKRKLDDQATGLTELGSSTANSPALSQHLDDGLSKRLKVEAESVGQLHNSVLGKADRPVCLPGSASILPSGHLGHLVVPPPPMHAYWGHPGPGAHPPGFGPFGMPYSPPLGPAWSDPGLMYWYSRQSLAAAYNRHAEEIESKGGNGNGGSCPVEKMKSALARLESQAKGMSESDPKRALLLTKADRLKQMVKTMEKTLQEFEDSFECEVI
ncbi:Transforming protein Ski [Halotydeus destructor]|nr:Transforming protein Ski [Halotydeus destructor]